MGKGDHERRAAPALAGLLLVCVAGLGGCGRNGGDDVSLQQRYETLMVQYQELQQLLVARERQIVELGGQVEARPSVDQQPAAIGGLQEDPFAAVALGFGRGTEAFDRDNDGRAELVRLLIQPRDRRGETIRRTGPMTVELLAGEEEGQPLLRREFTPAQLADEWADGMLGSGFFIELELPAEVRAAKLTAVVRLTTLEGRELIGRQLLEAAVER